MTVEEAMVAMHRAIRVTGVDRAGYTARDLANIATRNAAGTELEADTAAAISTLEHAGLLTGSAYLTQPKPVSVSRLLWGQS